MAIDIIARAMAANAQGGGEGGTSDYNQLSNQPKINGVTLRGSKTADELNLQPKGDYATTDYVEQEIATFDFIKIVTELPETGLVNRTYFVPKTDTETNDLYDEYMWVDGKWELIGTKQIDVDLTDYVKNTDYATEDKAGVVKIKDTQGIGMTSTKYLMIKSASSASIKAGSNINQPIIPEKQHESVFYGLAKASGDKTQSVSSNKVGTYTDEAKASIKNMLGIDLSNKADKIEVIENTDVTELQPNKYYKWGEVASLSLTLGTPIDGILNEYMFEFVSGATPTTLTLPDTIKWETIPTIEANKKYQISIVNNIALIVGV